MESFSLPTPSQENFTHWFGKKIVGGEVVVYPGETLPCTTKHRQLKQKVQPKHVFITQNGEAFQYKLYGSDRQFIALPKRLYSVCFPNISLHSIPTDNRIRIRLTEQTTTVVPVIPDAFLEQKRSKQKRAASAQPQTRASAKRQRSESNASKYDGWIIHTPLSTTQNSPQVTKEDLINYIHTVIRYVDTKASMVVRNPFEGAQTIEEVLQSNRPELQTIVRFIYHFMRTECGVPPPQNVHATSHVQEFAQTL